MPAAKIKQLADASMVIYNMDLSRNWIAAYQQELAVNFFYGFYPLLQQKAINQRCLPGSMLCGGRHSRSDLFSIIDLAIKKQLVPLISRVAGCFKVSHDTDLSPRKMGSGQGLTS